MEDATVKGKALASEDEREMQVTVDGRDAILHVEKTGIRFDRHQLPHAIHALQQASLEAV